MTIDTLESDRFTTRSLGGPPCYTGLTVRNLGSSVQIITKIGHDFREEDFLWLSRNQLEFGDYFYSSSKPTTRFKIIQTDQSRDLFLSSRCEDLSIAQLESVEADGLIVSSVAGEVSRDFMEEASRTFRHVTLDPQGQLRSFDSSGRCSLSHKLDLEILRNVNTIKIGEDELPLIAGTSDRGQALAKIRGRGPENILLTNSEGEVWVATPETTYSIHIPMAQPIDTTGLGDIFIGAYADTYLKDGDAAWSACMAVSAAHLSLNGVGISKIPVEPLIRENAEKISETVQQMDQF